MSELKGQIFMSSEDCFKLAALDLNESAGVRIFRYPHNNQVESFKLAKFSIGSYQQDRIR